MASLYVVEQGARIVREGELEEKITRRIEPEDDSVRIYRICAACRTAIKVIGRGPEPSEPAGNFEVV